MPHDAGFGLHLLGRRVRGRGVPKTVARGPKRRVNDLPTGASRLDTPAVGLHGVRVNGVRTGDAGGIIPDRGRSGRLLREFAV